MAKFPFTLVSCFNPLHVAQMEEEMDMARSADVEERRRKMFADLVDMVGGPKMAAQRLIEHNNSPFDVAIQLLGGPIKAAEKLGMSRANLWKMLRKPERWTKEQLKTLAQLSGVPSNLLVDSEVPSELATRTELTVMAPKPAAKSKRGRKMT
jgi:hypothetical protein